jgi:hypothetical protein
VIAESLEQGPVADLRPHHHLYSQCFVAILALLAPIFAVLYWLAIPGGGWPSVLVAQLVVTALLCAAVLSCYLMRISVDGESFTSRDALGRRRVVPFERVGSVIRLDLYRNGSLDLQPHLVLLGQDGELLLRMHGQCWPAESLETMIRLVRAPVVRIAEPMFRLELNRVHPQLLHWFERRFIPPDFAD